MTAYVGKAPLTNIVCAGKRMVAVLRGSPVPADALDSEVERLLADGFIVEGDTDGGIAGADAAEVSAGPPTFDYDEEKAPAKKTAAARK